MAERKRSMNPSRAASRVRACGRHGGNPPETCGWPAFHSSSSAGRERANGPEWRVLSEEESQAEKHRQAESSRSRAGPSANSAGIEGEIAKRSRSAEVVERKKTVAVAVGTDGASVPRPAAEDAVRQAAAGPRNLMAQAADRAVRWSETPRRRRKSAGTAQPRGTPAMLTTRPISARRVLAATASGVSVFP